MTTHVCLTARAFGADRVYVDTADAELEQRLSRVAEQFGGEFEVRTDVSPRGLIKSSRATVVHLTMYGENIGAWDEKRWEELRSKPCVLVVVGSTKVPKEYYEMADVNAAVGNQPHSEVAALAVFLDRLTGGSNLMDESGGKVRVVPQERGKLVIDVEEDED
ncbi:MAG: tRNA (cytidine(56)-2'-O)-methyltransferase [Thermoplasmata archaeon]|nr:MAG: tRNA (cytidine(56)-2'-O)-methyltransferase [Thermoplasmata archaeon]